MWGEHLVLRHSEARFLVLCRCSAMCRVRVPSRACIDDNLAILYRAGDGNAQTSSGGPSGV